MKSIAYPNFAKPAEAKEDGTAGFAVLMLAECTMRSDEPIVAQTVLDSVADGVMS